MLTLSQRASFSCCYIMDGVLNPHDYKVEATIQSSDAEDTRDVILDFDRFKTLLKSVLPNRAFLTSDIVKVNVQLENDLCNTLKCMRIPVVKYSFEICTETLCAALAQALQAELTRGRTHTEVIEFKLRESNDAYATWTKPE